jgi:hypothetical protein
MKLKFVIISGVQLALVWAGFVLIWRGLGTLMDVAPQDLTNNIESVRRLIILNSVLCVSLGISLGKMFK